MARVRQGIITRKKATNRNKKSKYTYATNKTVSQTVKNNKQTTRYAYTRRIKVNGRYKYSYT